MIPLLEKIYAFSLISPYFSLVFFANSENAIKFKETSEFRQETLIILSVKIRGITFGIFRMKSQFQPDFIENFLT